jgi:DNA-binding NtrC family response regulator
MSEHDPTTPHRMAGLPVRELRVSITSGPSRGAEAASIDEPITVGSSPGNTIELADPTASRYHLELARRDDRIAVTDLGSTNGTRIGPVLLRASTALVPAGTTIGVGRSELVVSDGAMHLAPHARRTEMGALRGRSDAMQRIMDKIEQLADKNVPVLIVGESGAGKEVVARALHESGRRGGAPFVTFDCGAIAKNLFESALFGHERGAFTGAEARRAGAFERAHGGTLFLDEIGELPPEQQVALLGVLERRRLVRVGGSEEIAVDVRVIAATNRDLREEVNRGVFRLDLYYRLAVVTLHVPPLRDRPEDVPLLIERFAMEEGSEVTAEELFGRAALDELLRYRWPGNARELRNVVAATLAMGEPPAFGPPIGDPDPTTDPIPQSLGRPYREAKALVTRAFETRYVRHLLAETDGNVLQAAKLGGMNRSYLIELIRRHGIK